MRALSPIERDALAVLLGPPADYDANTPEGARLDAGMVMLIARGCAIGGPWPGGGAGFSVTDLGCLAWRVSQQATP